MDNYISHQSSSLSSSYYDNHYQSGSNKYHESFYNKRDSIDSAYDSLLLQSTINNSPSSLSITNNIFSHPTTPVKTTTTSFIYNGNNCSTTPDFKQQYVADINGFYFSSIRQSSNSLTTTATPSTCSSYTSPFKSSNSNSPIKYCSSVDTYVHKRDTFSTKLLRSPAFKLEQLNQQQQQQNDSPSKPFIKSFNSRFQSNLNLAPPQPLPVTPTTTTPTEEEFMQMLIDNHHLPDNPEFLIGRHMGLEHVDILTELEKRSMNTIVEKIFSFLNVKECVKVGCVSKGWRSLIKQDPIRNKERVKFLKAKHYFHITFKENVNSNHQIPDVKKTMISNFEQLDLMNTSTTTTNRRSFARLTAEQVALREQADSSDLLNGSQIKILDVNCMENMYCPPPSTNIKQTSQIKVIF
jgi:hypothetical protein